MFSRSSRFLYHHEDGGTTYYRNFKSLPDDDAAELECVGSGLADALKTKLNEIGIENIINVDFNIDYPPTFEEEEGVFERDCRDIRMIVPFVIRDGDVRFINSPDNDGYLLSRTAPIVLEYALDEPGADDAGREGTMQYALDLYRDCVGLGGVYDNLAKLHDKYPNDTIYISILAFQVMTEVAAPHGAPGAKITTTEISYFMSLLPENNRIMTFSERRRAGYLSANIIDVGAAKEAIALSAPGFDLRQAEHEPRVPRFAVE